MTRSSAGTLATTGQRLLVGVAALALLAGCGSDEDDTGSAGAAPSARAASPSATLRSPAPRRAADGTRLSACRDGTCEVLVNGPTSIPVDRKSKIASVRVKSISPEAISLTAIAASTPSGYTFNSSCEGGVACTTSIDNDKADIMAHAGAKITLNRLVIQVTSIAGGSAILRLSPA